MGNKYPSIFIKEQPRLVDKQNKNANMLHNNACTPRRPCGKVLCKVFAKEKKRERKEERVSIPKREVIVKTPPQSMHIPTIFRETHDVTAVDLIVSCY